MSQNSNSDKRKREGNEESEAEVSEVKRRKNEPTTLDKLPVLNSRILQS